MNHVTEFPPGLLFSLSDSPGRMTIRTTTLISNRARDLDLGEFLPDAPTVYLEFRGTNKAAHRVWFERDGEPVDQLVATQEWALEVVVERLGCPSLTIIVEVPDDEHFGPHQSFDSVSLFVWLQEFGERVPRAELCDALDKLRIWRGAARKLPEYA